MFFLLSTFNELHYLSSDTNIIMLSGSKRTGNILGLRLTMSLWKTYPTWPTGGRGYAV